ncbi:unnamed protein product [Lota lota]
MGRSCSRMSLSRVFMMWEYDTLETGLQSRTPWWGRGQWRERRERRRTTQVHHHRGRGGGIRTGDQDNKWMMDRLFEVREEEEEEEEEEG